MSEQQPQAVVTAGPVEVSISFDPALDLLQRGALQAPHQPGLLARLDRFDILRIIGSGGMGVVLLARDSVSGRNVAVKLLKPELAEEPRAVHRFLTEARHMERLSHPNILPVLEVSDRPQGPYFVVAFMERGSLSSLIRPGKPLDEGTTLRVARDVADALRCAHERGIIHRDLKPGNVLIDNDGKAYLADFGLLRTVYNDSIVDVRRNQCEGTAPYMSPSVAAGQAEDTRCDIYSFGAMLYEMLTGDLPYEGATTAEVIRKVLAGSPEPILHRNSQASKPLAAIAESAMARELRDRYASMADVVADLKRVERGQKPLGPHGGSPSGLLVFGVTRRRLPWVAALVVVIAAVAVFSLVRFGTQTSPFAGATLSITDECGDRNDGGIRTEDTQVGQASELRQFTISNTGDQPVQVWDLVLKVDPKASPVSGVSRGPEIYRGHHYYLLSQRRWADAEAAANALGGHLASVNDAGEQAWLADMFNGEVGPWIGLTQAHGGAKRDAGWSWSNGEPFSYTNWSAGEPNDSNNGTESGAESRGHLRPTDAGQGSGRWNDASDDETRPAIVEIDPARQVFEVVVRDSAGDPINMSRFAIPPGERCVAEVRFRPQPPSSGVVAANLTFNTSDPAKPSVSLGMSGKVALSPGGTE